MGGVAIIGVLLSSVTELASVMTLLPIVSVMAVIASVGYLCNVVPFDDELGACTFKRTTLAIILTAILLGVVISLARAYPGSLQTITLVATGLYLVPLILRIFASRI